MLHVAAHEHADRAHLAQRDGDLEVAEGLADATADHFDQVGVAHAGHGNGADAGHVDAARAIDGGLQVGVDGPPDREIDLVAGTHHVVRRYARQRILARRRDGVVGDEVGAESAHRTARALGDAMLVLHLRRLGARLLLDIELELARLVVGRVVGQSARLGLVSLRARRTLRLVQMDARRSGRARRIVDPGQVVTRVIGRKLGGGRRRGKRDGDRE